MSAAFLREPPHHLCLDYHRRTTHRFTEPHRSSSTPHLLHRDRLPSQMRLISERINRDRDLIRHSSIQGQGRGFAQPSTFHQRASIVLRRELSQQTQANFT
ncbi:unnamed protein product [Brassica rapa]|uniref:Uncharacterized protein n=1 Tax=Brassica campestris TaxID=3711 RepID=A0A8D9DC46_BRACM|nr:unnamed protein product [Brassica rapa]